MVAVARRGLVVTLTAVLSACLVVMGMGQAPAGAEGQSGASTLASELTAKAGKKKPGKGKKKPGKGKKKSGKGKKRPTRGETGSQGGQGSSEESSQVKVALSGTVKASIGYAAGALGETTTVTAWGSRGKAVGNVDANGVFSMDLEPGDYKLQVNSTGFMGQWYTGGGWSSCANYADTVTVGPGGANINVTVYGFARVSGSVTYAEAGLDSDTMVSVYDAVTGEYLGRADWTDVGPDGKFDFRTLFKDSAGQFKVHFISENLYMRGGWYHSGRIVDDEADAEVLSTNELTGLQVVLEMQEWAKKKPAKKPGKGKKKPAKKPGKGKKKPAKKPGKGKKKPTRGR